MIQARRNGSQMIDPRPLSNTCATSVWSRPSSRSVRSAQPGPAALNPTRVADSQRPEASLASVRPARCDPFRGVPVVALGRCGWQGGSGASSRSARSERSLKETANQPTKLECRTFPQRHVVLNYDIGPRRCARCRGGESESKTCASSAGSPRIHGQV